ncbi:MAG: hypothetical protein KDE27_05135 [Planctomycetes bacterium]|nr:hypothetical protein [Planctomycetota bacterium]
MNPFETAARERHLTAVLAEAMGEQVPSDLSARIHDRLARAPSRRSRTGYLAAACVAAGVTVVFAVGQLQRGGSGNGPAAGAAGAAPGAVALQDPQPAVPEAVELQLRVVDVGATAGESTKSRLEWRLGEQHFATAELAAAALRRVVAATKAAPSLVIAPAEGIAWRDVVKATDMAMAAGFADIRWQGIGARSMVPKEATDPVVAAGELELPPAEFRAPDEDPDVLRPVLDLYRNGRIAHAGVTLFAPRAGEDTDLTTVRTRLDELRRALESARPAADAGSQLPILVRVDRGTAWNDVQRLLKLTTAAGFNSLEFAVAGRQVR